MDCDARRRAMRSKNMKTVTIRLTMMTDNVKNFVSLVNRYPYDMDLRSGRYVVDAKSILGIFSIDLSRPITMSIYSDDCDDLLRDLDGYIVLQLGLDIALLETGHIQIQLVVIVIFLHIAVHQALGILIGGRHIEHIIKHIGKNVAEQHNNPSIEIDSF